MKSLSRAPRLLVIVALLAAANGAYAATAAGTAITNQATATYLDAQAKPQTATSNTVVTTVQQVASLTLTAGSAKNAAAGTQVAYSHTVTNTGNGADTFNLTSANTGAFSMTGVQFFADANGDGVADNATPLTSTGSMAAGATFKFVAVGTLPAGAAAGATNTITVTTTSAFTGTVKADATDTTTVAAGAQLDITANTVGGPGAGAGAEASAVVTNTTAPGTTSRFTLVLNNSGASPDTFNLQTALDAAMANQTLPSGWTVVWKDAGGSVITNVTVAANSNKQIFADVTIPAGTAEGTTNLFFRAISSTSGVSDIIHNAITVAAITSQVTLTKSQALDATCDGVADTAFSNAPITTGALPGACIRYQITATNSGGAAATNVVIHDTIPANTTYHTTNPLAATLGAVLATLTGGVGSLDTTIGTLAPGASGVMTFGVKINP